MQPSTPTLAEKNGALLKTLSMSRAPHITQILRALSNLAATMGGKHRSQKFDVLVTSSAWLSHPLKVEADWSITAFYIVSHRFGKKSAGSRYCSFSANGANAPGVSGSHRWCKEWKSNKRKCSVSRNSTYPPKEPLIVMGTCTSVASKHFHCLIGCKVIGTTTFTRCSEPFRCVWPSVCGRWNG